MSAPDVPNESTLEAVRAAKSAALATFERLGQVAGIGITRIGKGYGLKVNLQAAPAQGVELPISIQGIPVRIEVVGALKKRPVT